MHYLTNNEWKYDIPFQEVGDFFHRKIKERSRTILVVGKQGSGKSVSAAHICMKIDNSFSKNNMCWDMDSFYEKTENLIDQNNDVDVMIADDFGSEADAYEFITDSQKNLNHVLEKYRTLHIGLFITVPNPRFISKNIRDRISDYDITILGHNAALNLARAQIRRKVLRFDKDRPDMPHLYGYLDGHLYETWKEGRIKITSYDIPKPPDSQFGWYKAFREELGTFQFKKSKGAHDKLKAERKKGTKEQIIEDAKKIMDREEYYIKVWHGKRILNVDLVRADFGYSSKYAKLVNAFIRKNYLED
jgi:hypothetical protein